MTKYIILTYDKNMPMAEATQKRLKEEWDITAEIVLGYSIGEVANDGKKILRTKVVSYGWSDKFLPSVNTDVVYLEDDIIFTKDPENYVNIAKTHHKTDILWMVYRKGKLTAKPNVITGLQAIYFSEKAITQLKQSWNQEPIHAETQLSRFILRHPQLIFFQLKKPIGYEQEHQSLISLDKWSQYTKPR